MPSKRTKALSIPQSVKKKVYERDNGRCIICGRSGAPNAHYISRAHSGLGIEENIVTLCHECHRAYDQSIQRISLGRMIADYLKGVYPDWTEDNLIYRKDR